MLYGRKSFELNPAMDFVILASLRDEKGIFTFKIAFTPALALAAFSMR